MAVATGDAPARERALGAIFERYAKEKGVVPVADDWNPWESM